MTNKIKGIAAQIQRDNGLGFVANFEPQDFINANNDCDKTSWFSFLDLLDEDNVGYIRLENLTAGAKAYVSTLESHFGGFTVELAQVVWQMMNNNEIVAKIMCNTLTGISLGEALGGNWQDQIAKFMIPENFTINGIREELARWFVSRRNTTNYHGNFDRLTADGIERLLYASNETNDRYYECAHLYRVCCGKNAHLAKPEVTMVSRLADINLRNFGLKYNIKDILSISNYATPLDQQRERAVFKLHKYGKVVLTSEQETELRACYVEE